MPSKSQGMVIDQHELYRKLDFTVFALAIAQEIGDRANEGIWLGNLGIVYRSLGEYTKAINYLEQGLSIGLLTKEFT